MTDQPYDLGERDEEHDSNSAMNGEKQSVFSYYRDDNKETGGMKVKWTIRVADSAEATRLDTRQNHAIRELLAWARQQQRR
jgi:hypothetical protein